MKPKNLKLYVWEGVFCDYTCGMAVALAYTKEEAIQTLVKETGWGEETVRQEIDSVEPEVIQIKDRKKPIAWYVEGGD